MRHMILGGMSVLLLSTLLVPAGRAAESITTLYTPRVPSLPTTAPREVATMSTLYAPRAYQSNTSDVTAAPTQPETKTVQVKSSWTDNSQTRYHYITMQNYLQSSYPQSKNLDTTEVSQDQAVQSTKINQIGSRQPFFSSAPRLIRSNASQKGTYVSSTYEFTLTLPENAGEPLKAVRIAQVNNLEVVKFDVSRSKAFAGDRFAAGPEIPLASIGGSGMEQPGEVTIVFDQPVQPGSTVTVALETNMNPNWDGIYLFGVTAFPRSENGRGQFLGYGRISIYGNSN